MRKSMLRFAIVCGILLCTGCLVVPFPDLVSGASKGRVVKSGAVKFIEPGRTTREDVLLRLGSPESATQGEFVYDSLDFVGFRIFVIPLCAPDTGGEYTIYARRQRIRVEILFDADSRVRSVRVREEPIKQ